MNEIVSHLTLSVHVNQCSSNTYKGHHHARWHGAEQGDNSGACVIRYELF